MLWNNYGSGKYTSQFHVVMRSALFFMTGGGGPSVLYILGVRFYLCLDLVSGQSVMSLTAVRTWP